MKKIFTRGNRWPRTSTAVFLVIAFLTAIFAPFLPATEATAATGPAVTITAPTSGSYVNTATPVLSYTLTAGSNTSTISSVAVKVDNDATVTAETTQTISGTVSRTWNFPSLADGPHTATVTATDADGYPSYATSIFTVDTVAPTVNITTAPIDGSLINITTPALAYSVTDSNTVSTVVTLNGVQVLTANSISTTLGPLNDGPYTLKITSTDAAGNTTTKTLSFTVDTVAPNPPVLSSVATITASNESTVSVAGITEANSTVIITATDSANNSVTATDTNTANGTFSANMDLSGLKDGTITFIAKAVDAANNTSTASAPVTAVKDTTAPAVNIASPATGSLINTKTPTLTYSVVDSSTPITEVVEVDGVTQNVKSGDLLTGISTDGTHTVKVIATDPMGNSGSATSTFTVDTVAPNPPVLSSVATITASNQATVSVTGTAEANSTVIITATSNKGGASKTDTVTASSNGTFSANMDLSGLRDGTITFTAKAVDAAGNTSTASAPVTAVKDTVTLTIISPSGAIDTNTPTLTYSVVDSNTAAAVLLFIDGQLQPNVVSSGYVFNPLSDGPHSITINYADSIGNIISASSSFTVKSAITINNPVDGSVINTDTVKLDYSVADTNTPAKLQGYSLDNGEFHIIDSSPTVIGSLTDGTHSLTIYYVDSNGKISTASSTFTVITTPLYRLYNKYSGDHFYTTDSGEATFAENNAGYTYEGIAAYVSSTQTTGTTPLYRLYNKYSGDHFYTADSGEKDTAQSLAGYNLEGIAAYVWQK